MDNGTWNMSDNETWTITLDNSSEAMNVSVTPTGKMLNEQELINIIAAYTFGKYYSYNFPITFIVCVVGFVTNTLNIIVFTRKNMVNSVNFFLAALSGADILLLISQLPYSVHDFFNFRSLFTYNWVAGYLFLVVLESVGITLCNWLAVTIGIWRWLAVNWPLRAREWCSMSRAKKILVVIVSSGLVVSLPSFAILRIKGEPLYGKILYSKDFTKFASYGQGIFLKLFWGFLLLINFVPCVILVIINGLLFRSLFAFRSRRCKNFAEQNYNDSEVQREMNKNYKTTMMLTVLLVLFVINNLPDSVLVLAAFFTENSDFRDVTDLLRVFSMVNNAVSFFIYYFMGENFRTSFKAIFNYKRFFSNLDNARKKDSVVTLSSDLASDSPRDSLTNQTAINPMGFSEGGP